MTFNDTGATGRSRGETSGNGGLSPEAGAGVPREPGLDARSLADLAAQDALELSRTPDAATMPLTADGGDGWSRTEASGPVPRPSTVAPGALEAVKDQGSSPEIQSPVTPRLFGQTMVRGAAMGQPETADDSKSGSGSGEEVLRTGTFTPDQGPTDVLPVSEDTGTGDRGTTNRLLGSDLTPRGGSGGGDTEAAGAQDSSPADLDTTDPDQDSHPDTETLGASSPDDLKTGGTNPDSELASDPDAPSTSLEVSQSPMEPDDTKTEPTPPMALFLGTTTGTAAETPGATVARTSSTDNPSHPGTMEARDTTGGDDPSTDGPDNPDNSSGTTDPASGGSSSELVRKNSGDNPTPSPQAGGTGAGQGNGEDVGGTGGDSGDGGGGDDDSGGGSGDIGDDGHGDRGEDEGGGDALDRAIAELLSAGGSTDALRTDASTEPAETFAGRLADLSGADLDRVIQSEALGEQEADTAARAKFQELLRVSGRDSAETPDEQADIIGEAMLVRVDELLDTIEADPYIYRGAAAEISQGLAYAAEVALRQGDVAAITAYAERLERLMARMGVDRTDLRVRGSLARIYLAGTLLGDETLTSKLHGLLAQEQRELAEGANRTTGGDELYFYHEALMAAIEQSQTSVGRRHNPRLAEDLINQYNLGAVDREALEWSHLVRLRNQGDQEAGAELLDRLEAVISSPESADYAICANAVIAIEACDNDILRSRMIQRIMQAATREVPEAGLLEPLVSAGNMILDEPAEAEAPRNQQILHIDRAIRAQATGLAAIPEIDPASVAFYTLPWTTRLAAHNGEAPGNIISTIRSVLNESEAPDDINMDLRDAVLQGMAREYIMVGASGTLRSLMHVRQVMEHMEDSDAALAAYVACWRAARDIQTYTGLRPPATILGERGVTAAYEAAQALFSDNHELIIASALVVAASIQAQEDTRDGPDLPMGEHPYWGLLADLSNQLEAVAPQEVARMAKGVLRVLLGNPATNHPTSEVMDALYLRILGSGELLDFMEVFTVAAAIDEEELDPESLRTAPHLLLLAKIASWLQIATEQDNG